MARDRLGGKEPRTGVNSTASDAGRRREGSLCDGGTGVSGKRPLDSRFDKDSSDKRMKHDEDSLMRGPDGGGGGSGKRPPETVATRIVSTSG